MNKCFTCKKGTNDDCDRSDSVLDSRIKCSIMLLSVKTQAKLRKSSVMQVFSANAIRRDLLNYEEPEIEKARWIDIDLHKSKLLDEFKAHIKIPILSEEAACRVLLNKSAPELPTMLADVSLDCLEAEDIRLSYWYWSYVAELAEDANVYDKTCSIVYLKSRRGNPNEMRPLGAFPLLVIAEETRYAFPLLESLKRGDCGRSTCYTLEKDEVCMLDLDQNLFKFLKLTFPSDYQIMVVDYCLFDSVVPNWIVKLCFDVLMQKLDFSGGVHEWNDLKKAEILKNRRRFKMIEQYFLKTSIHVRYPPAFKIEKARGIPLGSYFTNLIRTMSNFVMTRILCNIVFREWPCSHRFHGSKCVLVFGSYVELDIDEFSRCAKDLFGIVVDPHRTCITANVDDFHTSGYCCNDT